MWALCEYKSVGLMYLYMRAGFVYVHNVGLTYVQVSMGFVWVYECRPYVGISECGFLYVYECRPCVCRLNVCVYVGSMYVRMY